MSIPWCWSIHLLPKAKGKWSHHPRMSFICVWIERPASPWMVVSPLRIVRSFLVGWQVRRDHFLVLQSPHRATNPSIFWKDISLKPLGPIFSHRVSHASDEPITTPGAALQVDPMCTSSCDQIAAISTSLNTTATHFCIPQNKRTYIVVLTAKDILWVRTFLCGEHNCGALISINCMTFTMKIERRGVQLEHPNTTSSPLKYL